jgi:hypothetical protein
MYKQLLNEPVRNRILTILLWSIFLLILLKSILHGMNTLPFSPDSWSYWELSKTILSDDPYRIHGWRQFQTIVPYSMSFPPLWPLFISIFDRGSLIGPSIMPLLAGTFFFIGVVILETAFRRHFNIKHLGILGGFLLLFYPGFVSEITAGRSIPFAFMLVSAMLYIWLKSSNWMNTLQLAFFSGLLILTRFDMLPFVLLFGVAIYIKQSFLSSSKGGVKYLLYFYFIVLITISPYILYSMTHFDKIFATDNAMVAKSAYKIFVTAYFVNPLPTIFDEPILWIQRIAGNALELFIRLKYIIFIALVDLIMIFSLYRSEKITHEMKLFVIFLSVYLVSLLSYVLTGYFDSRYFSILVILIAILSVVSVQKLADTFNWSSLIAPSIAIALGISLVLKNDISTSKLHFKPMTENEKIISSKLDNIPLCYKYLSDNSKIMFPNSVQALLVSSSLHISTALTPKNFQSLSAFEKQNFIEEFQIKAYYGDDTKVLEGIPELSFEACKYDSKFFIFKGS